MCASEKCDVTVQGSKGAEDSAGSLRAHFHANLSAFVILFFVVCFNSFCDLSPSPSYYKGCCGPFHSRLLHELPQCWLCDFPMRRALWSMDHLHSCCSIVFQDEITLPLMPQTQVVYQTCTSFIGHFSSLVHAQECYDLDFLLAQNEDMHLR